MILLTSFKESTRIIKHSAYKDANLYSVSRFQPAGYSYIDLPFFAAVDINGNKLKLRGQDNPLYNYKMKLAEYYESVRGDIDEWCKSLDSDAIDILCCWCPHASHSKEQMRIYNCFVCHIGLVAREIEKRRHDINILMDHDHCIYLENSFKPYTYTILVQP